MLTTGDLWEPETNGDDARGELAGDLGDLGDFGEWHVENLNGNLGDANEPSETKLGDGEKVRKDPQLVLAGEGDRDTAHPFHRICELTFCGTRIDMAIKKNQT